MPARDRLLFGALGRNHSTESIASTERASIFWVEPEVRVEGRGGVVVVGGFGGALLVLLLHAVVVDQVDAPSQVHDRGAGDLGESVVDLKL